MAGLTGFARSRLFDTWGNGILTVTAGAVIAWAGYSVFSWAVWRAVWMAPDDRLCREAGACWAVIGSQWRLILFGTYPVEELWRPALAIAILLTLMAASLVRQFWRRELLFAWLAGLAVSLVLMGGGLFGLRGVETERWTGLPLTLLLGLSAVITAFPLAVMLALGRRSAMPVIRVASAAVIELVRGLPLVSLLFTASLLIPLFLPTGFNIDKLVRAYVALTVFSAAYLAEVIRGGLQSLPKGQDEAGMALGLSYGQRIRLIVLPQALLAVVPALANTLIVMLKNTSLVLVVGIFDLLAAAKAVLSNPSWSSSSSEVFAFVSIIYFGLSFYISVLARRFERTGTGRRGA